MNRPASAGVPGTVHAQHQQPAHAEQPGHAGPAGGDEGRRQLRRRASPTASRVIGSVAAKISTPSAPSNRPRVASASGGRRVAGVEGAAGKDIGPV
jgi:hypothetical protein